MPQVPPLSAQYRRNHLPVPQIFKWIVPLDSRCCRCGRVWEHARAGAGDGEAKVAGAGEATPNHRAKWCTPHCNLCLGMKPK